MGFGKKLVRQKSFEEPPEQNETRISRSELPTSTLTSDTYNKLAENQEISTYQQLEFKPNEALNTKNTDLISKEVAEKQQDFSEKINASLKKSKKYNRRSTIKRFLRID